MTAASSSVVVEVSDSGRWRRRRPSEGGVGLVLIEAVMDAVAVRRGRTGTAVRMTKSVAER